MSRATVILRTAADRALVAKWAAGVPVGSRVEFKAPKRTLPQNDRMWAMLTDLSMQVEWHGMKLTPDDFKLIFLDALRRELGEPIRIVPNTDGTGFVNLSVSSSDLSKEEMTGMIELLFKFGAERGVVFQDERDAA